MFAKVLRLGKSPGIKKERVLFVLRSFFRIFAAEQITTQP